MQTQGSDVIETPEHTPQRGHLLEVLGIFTRLGLTSFGGPVAHLGYFREEIVFHRKWVDERTYGDLIGLCQFLPGPASSQVGISLGIIRAGLLGGLMAWLGFTLPSAILIVLFAYSTSILHTAIASGVLHGLMVVAVAVRLALAQEQRCHAHSLLNCTAYADSTHTSDCQPGVFRVVARVVSATQPVLPGARAGLVWQLLSQRLTGLWRWTRSPATAADSSSGARMGDTGTVPYRVQRRSSRPRSPVYLLRLPGSNRGANAQWLGRGNHRVTGDLSPLVPAAHRRLAILELTA